MNVLSQLGELPKHSLRGQQRTTGPFKSGVEVANSYLCYRMSRDCQRGRA